MAYYYRRYYYRRRYRRRYNRGRFYRYGGTTSTKSSYNYFNASYEVSGLMNYPAADAGSFGIVKSNQIVNSNNWVYMLSGIQSFGTMKDVFSQWHIRSAVLEVTPSAKNLNNEDIINDNPLVAGLALIDIPGTFQAAQGSNNSVTLNSIAKVRKYIRFPFGLDYWYDTTDFPNGGIYAFGSGQNGTKLNSPGFTFKITVYVTYRQSKL